MSSHTISKNFCQPEDEMAAVLADHVAENLSSQKGYRLKDWVNRPERLAPGHRMCAGCGATIGVRAVLRALHEGDRAVIGNATGCLEVSSYMYPYTAWEDSYIHNAFENAGAT